MRASDRAYRALRDEIVEWQLRPGTVLAEVEQAARLGVSRTPVREALARLMAEGLVVTQAGRGLVVSELSTANLRELFEVRQALEVSAARLAALRGDRAVFSGLASEFAAVLVTDDADDPVRHDYYDLIARFDDAVDAAVANPFLVDSLTKVRTHLARARRLSKDNLERLGAAAAEHHLIASAIGDGDADLAAHATHVHLYRSLQNMTATGATGSPHPFSPPAASPPRSKEAQ